MSTTPLVNLSFTTPLDDNVDSIWRKMAARRFFIREKMSLVLVCISCKYHTVTIMVNLVFAFLIQRVEKSVESVRGKADKKSGLLGYSVTCFVWDSFGRKLAQVNVNAHATPSIITTTISYVIQGLSQKFREWMQRIHK